MTAERSKEASVSASSPIMGPVSDDEKAAIERFWSGKAFVDTELFLSLREGDGYMSAAYVLVRALRAGVRLEDLL